MGLDILGFFGYLVIWWGTREISYKRNGWGLRLAGDLIWLSIGMALGMWFSIVLWSIILGYTDLRGYLRWKNENSVM